MQKNDFLHLCKPKIYTKLSFCSHRFPVSTTTKIITCSFSFNQVLAASSPSTNRPKSKSGYLAIVSLKHGRLVRVRSQYSLFRRSPTRQNLPPATFDASEHVLFGYFLHAAKSNIKKTSLLLLFENRKALFPGFPETKSRKDILAAFAVSAINCEIVNSFSEQLPKNAYRLPLHRLHRTT